MSIENLSWNWAQRENGGCSPACHTQAFQQYHLGMGRQTHTQQAENRRTWASMLARRSFTWTPWTGGTQAHLLFLEVSTFEVSLSNTCYIKQGDTSAISWMLIWIMQGITLPYMTVKVFLLRQSIWNIQIIITLSKCVSQWVTFSPFTSSQNHPPNPLSSPLRWFNG